MEIKSFISIEKISVKEAGKIRLILFGTIALSLLTVKFYPLDLLNLYLPGLFRNDSSCISLNVFGIPCPFCGMSRAFREFMDFNFTASIFYNPFSVFFFVFLGMLCLSIFVLSFFKYKITFQFNRKTLIAFLIVTAFVWILNIFYGHH